MYPYEDKLLMNTAQVDPIKPDFSKFPKFSEANAMLCTLTEGMNFKNIFIGYKKSNTGQNVFNNDY